MYAASIASSDPQKPAMIHGTTGETRTFAEYEARANQLAHLCRDMGLGQHDHIAQLMGNSLEFAEIGGAAVRAGLYYTSISAYLSADEVAYIVADSQSRLLVASAGLGDVIERLPAMCPGVERFLLVGGSADGWESYEEAIARYPGTPIAGEKLGGVMLYSSGTTGRPKGIIRALPDQKPDAPQIMVEMSYRLFGFHDDMVYLSPAPLYHSAPQVALNALLRKGMTNIIMERFDAEEFLRLVEKHRVTHTQVVPTMLIRLLKLPEAVRAKYDVSSLQSIVHAGAPCPVAIKEQAMAWLGPIISEYYGATEGYGLTWCSPQDWIAHKGSVGKPIMGSFEVRDEAGNPCAAGVAGQVWIGGASDFEYFNDEGKTKAGRDDRGFSTVGDIGYIDEDGFLYLTDRATNMIISGGVNIYPQEVENILAAHPLISDVAVLGVPHDEFGEEVRAFVQLEDPAKASDDLAGQIIEYCRSRLAHFKCPKSVKFVSALPRTETGKLLKRLILASDPDRRSP